MPGLNFIKAIIMLRALISISLFLFSHLGFAAPKSPLYQIDMIVFMHQQTSSTQTDADHSLPTHNTNHAIVLKNDANIAKTPYHTLPASSSQLRTEYWALHRKPQYQVMFHYSWLQPGNSQKPIALPSINHNGWNLEGKVHIRQSNYYLLDTKLLFTAINSNQTPFVFDQQQRLKSGVVYYLDHPRAGMLIKVHKIS